MSSLDSPLAHAVERFLDHVRGENKSPGTVVTYQRSLQYMLGRIGVDDTHEIDRDAIRRYAAALGIHRTALGKELSVSTKNGHLTVLRTFLRYLITEEELDVYPPSRIRRLKQTDRQIITLTREELERLLAGPSGQDKISRRDKAILELFFSTGLRLSELQQLNRQQINLKTREISVLGKGRRRRLVFVSDRAAAALDAYLICRLDHLDPLFLVRHTQSQTAMPPGEEFRISCRSIDDLVRKYARLAGITTNPSPHTLRHSFATDLLQNGADLRSIQDLLGHRHIGTTQIYTHVTNPQLKAIHQACHGK